MTKDELLNAIAPSLLEQANTHVAAADKQLALAHGHTPAGAERTHSTLVAWVQAYSALASAHLDMARTLISLHVEEQVSR